jgi:DnaJ-class molecular chaperone
MSDYYNTLGVSKNSTPEDIKNAYKRLARTHHPDRGGNKEEFQKIQEAYETLSDNDKKNQYDNPGFGQNNMDNMFSFSGFEHPFFNHHMRNNNNNGTVKKNDHLYTCKITLRDVYYGITKRLKVHRNRICKSCIQNCNSCNGNGKITQHIQMGPFTQVVQNVCSNCNGSGGKSNNKNECLECNKTGYVEENNTFEINIKPGVNNGKKFIFDGWGEQPKKNNEIPGSFIVIVSIENDPFFTRNGLDLLCNIQLSYRDSIIGKNIIIQHFRGDIPLDTQGFGIINPNKNYILYNKGLLGENGSTGNLQIKFIIDYPERTFNKDEVSMLTTVFENINL